MPFTSLVYFQVILHHLNCERAKSLSAKLGYDSTELESQKDEFDCQVEDLEEQAKEAESKLSEIKSIRSFARQNKN